MLSPTTVRGLLGLFPRGAEPPATDQCETTPPVQSMTSLSLWAISAAGGEGKRGEGRGERLQGPEGGRREKSRRGRVEQERKREDKRRY